jgi:hypothetical protein
MSLRDITIENVLHSGKINKNCTKSHIRPTATFKTFHTGLNSVLHGHVMTATPATLPFDDIPDRHLKDVKMLSLKV